MAVKRRVFVKWGFLSSIIIPWARTLPAKSQTPRANAGSPTAVTLSILQGATDETSTQFSVLHDKNRPLSFFVKDSENQTIFPSMVETIEKTNHPLCLSKPVFTGLSLNRDYQLLVIDADQTLLQERIFRTLDLENQKLKFAVASCMDDEQHQPEIWQDMIQQKPDFILFVGDSVYADRNRGEEDRAAADPEQLWRRFCQARQTLEIYNSKRLIPILATWDDHDFGANDTGDSYPFIQESQKNFLDFFAQDERYCRGLVRGPGVSSAFLAGDQLFILLDNRSYRRKGASSDDNGHWGSEQMQWIFDLLTSHQGFVWFCNGSQVFPKMLFKESVSKEHPANLQKLVEFIKNRKNLVAFISGDVHFSELSQLESSELGYRSYEITSSSIHSLSFPGVPDIIPNKSRIAATGKRNYLLVESLFYGQGLEFQVSSRSENNRINFNKNLQIAWSVSSCVHLLKTESNC